MKEKEPAPIGFPPLTLEEAKQHVGKGWWHLLERLYAALPKGAHVAQVKEKFGGLRFYTDHAGKAYYHDYVNPAMTESLRTCEECGEPGTTKPRAGGFWVKTLCDRHHQEWNAAYEKEEEDGDS